MPKRPKHREAVAEFSDEPIKIESAKDEIVRERKLSMLSKPNKVKACIPDLSASEETLFALGLEKEKDGWHVHNREWFPNPLDERSIIIDYGTRADGSRDLGFCSQAEFATIYAHTDQYDQGNITYIDPMTLNRGEFVEATKCATGEFSLAPERTKVKTNEGEVIVIPGQAMIINEKKNSIFVTDITEILKRYVADPMNPASQKAFELLKEFEKKKAEAKSEEIPGLFEKLVNDYNALERKTKAYQAYKSEVSLETLRGDFNYAAELVKTLDQEISSKIDSLKFTERIEQAKIVLREVLDNDELTTEQKNVKISYILARLLPKTNNHQHLKGSVPEATLLERAKLHGFDEEKIAAIRNAYEKGAGGFDSLDDFNQAYGTIGSAIRTPEDYQAAVKGIIEEATKSGQLTVEIRCSVIGQRDSEGKTLDPHLAAENLLQAMDKACEDIGSEAPKTGLTFLGYRGKDWKPEEVIQHAQLAVEFAKKYPSKKFSFDVAGPEDTGYAPTHFKEAFDLIKAYNQGVKNGDIKGELIGVTTHAGETPTYDSGLAGHKAVEEAIEMGADRVGHSVQAVNHPETMRILKESGATVEICGVCNISSIPLNTRGMAIHPVQEFIRRGIPITICTDNDAICGTNITKEYAQFLLTGHNELMNWNTVKEAAKHGITSSFIPEADRAVALKIFDKRIRIIEKMVTEERIRERGLEEKVKHVQEKIKDV